MLTFYATEPYEHREMYTQELTALLGEGWLVTVRKHPDFAVDKVTRRWDDRAQLADRWVGYLRWGLAQRRRGRPARKSLVEFPG